ncbi:MAG: hypothetical protein PHW60_03700 [Kiritimatiellae bacterium]|nr:hypothetical protein [Kiritimatiellia bacterium]
MFSRIKTWIRRVWRRFEGPPNVPIVVQPHVTGTEGPYGRDRRAENRDVEDADFRRMDPAEAAREIFAPTHNEEESHGFVEVGPDGNVPHRGERWDREHNSMRRRIRSFMLVTCSKSVVSSAEEINGICNECHGHESAVVRCSICGVILCQLHAYVLEHPAGPAIYCKAHLKEAMDNWDTWEAYDMQRGVKPNRSVYPGKPHALARYVQK